MSEDLTATVSDTHRGLQFDYPSDVTPADTNLILRSFEGEDRLGRLFEYRLDLLSESMDVKFDKIVGEKVTISIDNQEGTRRFFNGYVTEFAFSGSEGRFGRFSATLRPWLWFLSRTSDCRIFQEKTVPEIIEAVFKDHGFSNYKSGGLTGTYQKRDYCVQYRESALDFVSRLMELEGIYYYFEHEERKHTLVLADSVSSHKENQHYAEVPYYPPSDDSNRHPEHLQSWMLRQSIMPTDFSQRAYDFEKPKSVLTTKSEVDHKPKHDSPLSKISEIYNYPGDFTELTIGEEMTEVLRDTWETQSIRAFSSGNARGMLAGCTFRLTEYEHQEEEAAYLIVSVHHEIAGDDPVSGNNDNREPYRCHIEAINKGWPYRSQRTTPKPVIRGPQTAKVVGLEGEEIFCDKYGRVKVRFHWDRDPLKVKDQDRTCWIRVSQIWAGKNWGGIHIPRIGQEVVVSFLEGDPDRPLITGAVYNAENMPPYALDANKTQSGIKSHSTKEGTPDNFNELRFEDLKDKEEVYFQAEKDLNSVVKNKESRKVGVSRTTEVGEGAYCGGKDKDEKPEIEDEVEITTIHASKKTEIKGNEALEIATDPRAEIGRDVVIKHADDKLVVEQGNVTQTVTLGDITRKAEAGKVLEEAMQSIELKVGQSSIKLEPSKITIKSPQISITGDMMAELKSPMTTVKGDATLTIQGGLVMIN